MDDLDRLLSTSRARRVFNQIANSDRQRMPCGDSRLVEIMRQMGGVRLTNPKERDMTTSWTLTQRGETKR